MIGINPHTMVIYMLESFIDLPESFSTICGPLQPRIHGKNDIGLGRVGDDLCIIITTGIVTTLFFPTCAAISRFEKTTTRCCFYNRINNIGVSRRDSQSDTPLISTRKPLIDFCPIAPCISCSVNATFRATANIGEHMTPSLKSSCINDIRVIRIHHDIIHPGMLING